MGKEATVGTNDPVENPPPECGVIMPISATATHPETHWRDVQLLLHRAIADAGFIPRNVWENTSTDRVSERIIGNLFKVPIAIADISDLNPNVMLELGLRLASKKPTLVIVNSGGTIPFDIRDFHAIFYPSDLNMLGMEEFFSKIAKNLKEKYSSFTSNSYTPFLSRVIVDVASPETRELGVNELLLSRLEDIGNRIGSLESTSRRSQQRSERPIRHSGTFDFTIPTADFQKFSDVALSLYEVDDVNRIRASKGTTYGQIVYSQAENVVKLYEGLNRHLKEFGGDLEVPF